jgi:hypothetical protein
LRDAAHAPARLEARARLVELGRRTDAAKAREARALKELTECRDEDARVAAMLAAMKLAHMRLVCGGGGSVAGAVAGGGAEAEEAWLDGVVCESVEDD